MKSGHLTIIIITILAFLAISMALITPFFLKERVTHGTSEHAELADRLIAAKGVVESEEEIEISSQVSGIVSEIHAHEGDTIKKGQPLVLLDNHKIMTKVKLSEAVLREATARLRELESGYREEDIEIAQSKVNRIEIIHEKAEDEYKRQERLYQKKSTTLMELERAQERMDVTGEELRGARANLKKFLAGVREEEIEQSRSTVAKATSELHYYQALSKDYSIFAPIDGFVVERCRDPGEIVDIGSPLMKLINPNKQRIRAELEETDVGMIGIGQSVQVLTDAYRDKVYHGRVSKVFPSLKRYSLRTFDPSAAYDINAQNIYIKLDDFSGLKNGMLVTVKFVK